MKKATLLLSFMVIAALLAPAVAAVAVTKKKAHKKAGSITSSIGPRENLSRDIRFGDSSVYGKYQYANEGTAEVENEKNLDDLLGVRTDFKDRLMAETRRQ